MFGGLASQLSGKMDGGLELVLSVAGNIVYRLTGIDDETKDLEIGG